MSIKIIAGAWARRYDVPTELDLKDGAIIADALAKLPFPPGEIGLTAVGGKAMPRDTVLVDGEELRVFPVIVDG